MAEKATCAQQGSRDKILDCARELFYHVGYQATSIDDILKRCGVVKSNFYYHFKTKETLALAVLESWVAEQETIALQTLQNASLAPTERMERFCAHVVQAQAEIQRAGGCPFGNFAASLPTLEDDERYERFRQQICQFFNRTEAALCECLTEGAERGEFRSDVAPSEMAAFLVAALQGLLILTKTHKDTSRLFNGLLLAQRLLRA